MRRIALSLAVLACGLSHATADDFVADAFALRNHNPFLQIYGLPVFRTAELVAPGGIDFDITFDIANDEDEADRLDEVLVIDSESRVVNLSLRRRFGERFEVGIDLPYVEHSGGSLDNLIYEFHDAVGLPNSTREGPDDEFKLFFARNGVTLFDMTTPTSGIGDVQVSAAMDLGKVTLRGGVKLPTGDPDKLTGSGAADVSLGVYGGRATTVFDRELAYSGFFGILALGEGEVMPGLQRDVVPYGGLTARWHATARFSLVTQLYAQGAYYDANLDELGGNTFQLAFGADYRFPAQRLLLRFAIAEDIAAAAAPDFALHLSIRRYSR
jgi:hypothetical protein